jgi:hypothetical protein
LLLAELHPDELVLAQGTGGERRRLPKTLGSSRSNYFLVTPRRLLWMPGGKARHRAELEFDSVTSWAEGTQSHYYCLVLRHEPIERTARAPEHRVLWFEWGDTEEMRRQTHTILNISRRDTKVATAIREQLEDRGVVAEEPLEFDERPREPNQGAVFRSRRRWRDRFRS